ncbi:MAG: serine/threonine protein kinase, partial [Proteobacteria bacterium]|nr:serine/threonine protein kinase [Pseudomonadota bacterium]
SLSERYTLHGELGRGGMAVVYRARDEALGREVALKFLSEEISNKRGMVELFQREARAAAQLNHPNIVTVYDTGELSGRTFIAMELVEGETIEDILDRQGRLKIIDALRISEAVLNALDYAHSKRIVHRDIKPSNIMRNSFNVVKLMDFGLAKSFDSSAKTTAICGTPLYMAPEQFVGRNIDARTDVFAAGATIYEMITGTPPFTDIRRDKPPKRLRGIIRKVPAVIDEMIARSLAFEREDRFEHAGQMLAITRGILEQVNSRMEDE